MVRCSSSGAKLWADARKRNRRHQYLPHICALLLAALAFVPGADGTELKKADLQRIFATHQAQGALVIQRKSDGKRWVLNEERAHRRFIPASTFKIPHTLIALGAGVVTDRNQFFEWDRVRRSIKSWNRSLVFREAFRVSAVPVFQKIARKIGSERMRKEVARLDYGNGETGPAIDRFWLEGPLAISASEQIEFLVRLEADALPVPKNHGDLLKDVMIDGTGRDWILRGKTGWTRTPDPDIGWYVGWLETGEETWFAALNIDMTKQIPSRSRRAIVVQALQTLTGISVR